VRNFVICIVRRECDGNKIGNFKKRNRDYNHENLKIRDHLGNLGEGGKIIFK
jgi:hypothetical protein